MTTKQQLSAYAKEIGIGKLSLEDLIKSHRRLRNMNLEANEERMKLYEQTFIQAIKDSEQAIQNDLFTVEQLKSMTVGELVGKLSG